MRIKRKRIINSLFFLFFSLMFFCFYAYGESLSYFSQDRDPFWPLISPQGRILIPRKVDIAGMSLEGIIYSEDNPVAIINGEVLSENDLIGEYTVLTINREKVFLEKEYQIYTLKLEVD